MGDSEYLDLTDIAVGSRSDILSEDRLRVLGKSLHIILSDNGDENEKPPLEIQQLRLDLFHTAKSTHLSPSHGAASLNALCRFLEICSTCHKESWSSLCFSTSTYEDLIHIVLDRSEMFKSKPAKQLLVMLSTVLASYPDEGVKGPMIRLVVSRCVKSVMKQEDAKSIKTSMNTLEHLIKRRIITAMDVVLASVTGRSVRDQSDHEIPPEQTPSILRPIIEDFITHVLAWIRYTDCASAISRLLPSFLASLDLCPATNLRKDASTELSIEVPFWIEPVRRMLKRDISLLDSFENHILPKLLCLSSWDRTSFLETLPFHDLQLGHVGHLSDADIQLCLLTTRVMALNPGLAGMTNLQSHFSITETDIQMPDNSVY